LADRSLLAHLFRRAAFGARPEELAFYASRPYPRAVEDLLSGRPIAGRPPDAIRLLQKHVVNPVGNVTSCVAQRDLFGLQTDWIRLMAETPTPLVERMTLFLHDHFATAFVPGLIEATELATQNELFRAHALGNWRSLCHALLSDVALGLWLNADRNLPEAPNENLARELMELFVLGADAGYTERDVREAARALTGYVLEDNLDPLGPRYRLRYVPERHDDGEKAILGRRGRFEPHSLMDLLLAHPAAPRHLARRLLETFVSPSPPGALIDRIAAVLRTERWELRPALRAIFLSPEFAAARGTLVKSPAEHVVGAWRALRRTEYDRANVWMGQMGQRLFQPPNVGGWPGGEAWLSAGFLLARYNAAVELASLHRNALRLPLARRPEGGTPGAWGEVFGLTELAPRTLAALGAYLAGGRARGFPPDAIDHGMVTLVVSSPDFSLA
jgi:uncharacterized protein (DUF1800 family)